MGHQIEQHDGGEYRSLRTPEWARVWIDQAVAAGDTEAKIRRTYRRDLARIEDAEERYYHCSPAARERADAELANDPAGDEWEDQPQWWARLADAAEAADGRSKAAAVLGRKGGSAGRGAAKARPLSSERAREIRAMRRPRTVRVVRGLGAAAGLWVVEHLRDGQWQQAALPCRTKAEAQALAAVVREHGAILGR